MGVTMNDRKSSSSRPKHKEAYLVYMILSAAVAVMSTLIWAFLLIVGGWFVYGPGWELEASFNPFLIYKYEPVIAFSGMLHLFFFYKWRTPGSPHLWGPLFVILSAAPGVVSLFLFFSDYFPNPG